MMADLQPLIELVDVTKTFDSGGVPVTVLHGVSLQIREGEFIALMGASGSGKTTLMNILGCLDRPSSGTYRFAGRDVSGLTPDELAQLRSTAFGFIFQRYNLISTETATENVEIPAIYAGVSARQRTDRARELLTRFGLGERLDYRPTQLSGGQQQRVSIARALMNGGRVILADEPTGALDTKSGAEVMAQLHDLHRAGHTLILITHDPKLAAEAERTVQIVDGLIVSDTGPVSRAVAQTVSAPHADNGGRLLPDIMEAVKMALRSLRTNLFRTVLTLLGIIIGVGAVVAMLALGDGSKQQVLSRIEAMGTDLLVVRPGAGRVRTRDETASLVAEDAEAITRLPNVLRAVPEYTGAVTIRYGDNDYVTSGNATTADYAAARNWAPARGGFFSEADVQSYAPVVVLGYTVVKNLFTEGEDPVGRYVLINNIPFQVVGVLTPKGATAFGGDIDDTALMPLSTGRMRLFGRRYVRAITVQVADAETDGRDRAGDQRSAAGAPSQGGFPGAQHVLAAGDRHRDPEHADHPARFDRRHLPAGGRHRRDEHHAGVGDRTGAGDRHTHGHRRAHAAHSAAVHHRGAGGVRRGRLDRSTRRTRRRLDRPASRLAGRVFAYPGAARLRQRLPYRAAVRLSAGAPRRQAGPGGRPCHRMRLP